MDRMIFPNLHPRLDRDTLVTIGFHLLMLLGVWFYGWSAYSLLILYWLETLVIGIWTVILVTAMPRQPIRLFSSPAQPATTGIGMALFVLAHAGVFMFVHLFMLQGLFGLDLGAGSVLDISGIIAFVLDGRLWLPLAGLFLIRALMTYESLRKGDNVDRQLTGFYFRIVVMQFAILGGGFLGIFLGAQAALIMLVIVRVGFELAVPSIEDYVEAHLDELHAARTSKSDKTKL
jgi:hypothetical protein